MANFTQEMIAAYEESWKRKHPALAEGWAIIHPDGRVEMDYFDCRVFHRPHSFDPAIDNTECTAEEWCKHFRPDCKIIKAQVIERKS
ncbi:MAG: hypothetical protein M0R80_07525 [Proteobacteria bacterium]|jgi:hypothetical protein|nr:hypothetical protein [Pseudomonadota bacterium]